MQNFSELLLRRKFANGCFINCRINFTLKNPIFSTSISETSENNCSYFMIGFLWSLYSLPTFIRVYSNSKEVSYLSWQNTYPNLKYTCHIKLTFFLWTKLLENLLLAKYLISVTAPLFRYHYRCLKKVIHQVDSKNGWLLLSGSLRQNLVVFVLTLENAFS